MTPQELITEALRLLRGGYIDAAYDRLEEALDELAKLEKQRG